MKNSVPVEKFTESLLENCPANGMAGNETLGDFVRSEVLAWCLPLMEQNVHAYSRECESGFDIVIDFHPHPDYIYSNEQCPNYKLYDILRDSVLEGRSDVDSIVDSLKETIGKLLNMETAPK